MSVPLCSLRLCFVLLLSGGGGPLFFSFVVLVIVLFVGFSNQIFYQISAFAVGPAGSRCGVTSLQSRMEIVTPPSWRRAEKRCCTSRNLKKRTTMIFGVPSTSGINTDRQLETTAVAAVHGRVIDVSTYCQLETNIYNLWLRAQKEQLAMWSALLQETFEFDSRGMDFTFSLPYFGEYGFMSLPITFWIKMSAVR